MPCDGLRDPVLGYPAKVSSAGGLRIATPDGVAPAAWTATANHGGNVTGSAAVIAAAPDSSLRRVYIRFTNTGAQNVFLFPGSTVGVADTPLAPGQTMEFHGGFSGDWYARTAGTTEAVAVIEFTVPATWS